MTIREYGAGDYDQLTALYKDVATFGGNFDKERDTPEKLLATSECDNLLIAVKDSEVLGSVMFLDNPHTFWLLRFAVKGNDIQVSKTLLSRAEKVASSRGHTSVIVYSDPGNKDLTMRYQDLGFTESPNYKCFWKGL